MTSKTISKLCENMRFEDKNLILTPSSLPNITLIEMTLLKFNEKNLHHNDKEVGYIYKYQKC